MASPTAAPPATALDKLGILITVARMVFAATTHLISAPIRTGPRANTFLKDILFAAFRVEFAVDTIPQEKYMNPPTDVVYLDFAKKQGFQPDTVVLSDGCKAHWLGRKDAKTVLVYFHGGGYVRPATPGHVRWMFDMTREIARKQDFSSILLSYTCAPEGQYPKQLAEAALLLQYLLDSGRKPSDLILCGDSAGANLALGLISHVLHPHPDVPTKIKLSEPLLGTILVSPWVKFGTDDDSATRNATSDVVPVEVAVRWGNAFLGKAPFDNYNQPILADSNWFHDIESVTKDLLIWGGSGEMLIDSINFIAKKLKAVHSRAVYVEQDGAAHEDMILDKILGYKHKAEGTKLIEEFVLAKL